MVHILSALPKNLIKYCLGIVLTLCVKETLCDVYMTWTNHILALLAQDIHLILFGQGTTIICVRETLRDMYIVCQQSHHLDVLNNLRWPFLKWRRPLDYFIINDRRVLIIRVSSQLIFTGEYTIAMNKCWHLGHFRCNECDVSITGKQFIVKDEKPVCADCFDRR